MTDTKLAGAPVYYCRACPEVFHDADASNAHHDATGHHQTWRPSQAFGARPVSPEAAPPRATTPEPKNFDHLRELVTEAREALRRVGPPSTPEQDRDGLYYPLLFLTEQVEATLRAVLRNAFDATHEENTESAAWLKRASLAAAPSEEIGGLREAHPVWKVIYAAVRHEYDSEAALIAALHASLAIGPPEDIGGLRAAAHDFATDFWAWIASGSLTTQCAEYARMNTSRDRLLDLFPELHPRASTPETKP